MVQENSTFYLSFWGLKARPLSFLLAFGIPIYPDYILGGNVIPGDERAFALIECKLDIETKKEMKDAFVQAKSYALRLQSEILVLAARRGLWIFKRRKEGFSIDHFLYKQPWAGLVYQHPGPAHNKN